MRTTWQSACDGDWAHLEVISSGLEGLPRREASSVGGKANVVQISTGQLLGAAGAIALLLVSFGSWLVLNIQDIKAGQAEMRARVEYTSGRVDRVVNEVPTLRGAIVKENSRAPVRWAIVTSPTLRRDSATSTATSNIIDLKSGKTTAHYLTLSNEQAAAFQPALIGAIVQSAPNAVSLRTFVGDQGSGTNANYMNSAQVPNYVDVTTTYMLFSSTDTVPLQGIKILFGAESTHTYRVSIKGGQTWIGVVREVRSHPGIYAAGMTIPRPPKPVP
jgi:hypothetical protein